MSPHDPNTARLFHLADPKAWDAHVSGREPWHPSSLDSEGFVHLSFAHQIAGTLEVHFAHASHLVVAELARDGLGEALRVEASRGDALFPHIYRAIAASEWLRWWLLQRDPAPDGPWTVPVLGDDASSDRPAGRTLA